MSALEPGEFAEHPEESRYWVKSVGRALDVLEILARDVDGKGMSVTEIGSELGLSKSAAFATLYTLQARGFVRDEGVGMMRKYRLGAALSRLGTVATATTSLRDTARPHLEQLARNVGATARFASLSGGRAVVIEQATGNERVRLDLALGSAETLHTTSLGKAILAQLPNEKVVEILSQVGMEPHTERSITSVDEFLEHLEIVRCQGYAINDEEDAHGVFGVAAPVFDYTGECLGAITITGLKRQQPSTWYYVDMARQVHEAASGLSRDLGYGRTMTFGGN